MSKKTMTITNMSPVARYSKRIDARDGEEMTIDTASETFPSSLGTPATTPGTPLSVSSSAATPPRRRHSSNGGRVRKRISSLKSRRSVKEEERNEVGNEEQREEIFQKRLQILFKNPTLFRMFQERCRQAECFTPVGIHLCLHDFLTDMRVVELLDDLRIEQEPEEDSVQQQQPRRRLGIFASFSYGRTTPVKDKPKARIHRNSRRSKVGSRHYETDDHSMLSMESIGLSLPSLENTEHDSDDCSSVGSMSVTVWESPSSLRSLNSQSSSPGSARSLLGIQTQEEEDADSLFD